MPQQRSTSSGHAGPVAFAVLLAVLTALLTMLGGCSSPAARPSAAVSRTPGSTAPAAPAAASRLSPRPRPSGTPAPRPTGHQRFTRLRTDGGRMLVTWLRGSASGVRMRVWVWLPPQYDQPRYRHATFPALMLYPGGSGAGYNTWVGRRYGAREIVARPGGHVTPFVFVMPQMQLTKSLDTECADLPGRPRVGTFLAVDVRRMVEANFRVFRDRAGWGAAGASSGGYCAARVVFGHPAQYSALVSISGYFTIETNLPGARTAPVLAGDPATLARVAPPDVAVLLWGGSGSPADVARARSFLATLRPPTTGTVAVLPGGRHLSSDFARTMPGTFAFLSSRLARPVL